MLATGRFFPLCSEVADFMYCHCQQRQDWQLFSAARMLQQARRGPRMIELQLPKQLCCEGRHLGATLHRVQLGMAA